MSILSIATFLLLGGVFGFAGGLFGIGGGILAIPILGIFFGMPQALAQGTALIMALPNVFVAVWRYHKKVGIDLKLAGIVACIALPFTFISAHVATLTPNRPLRIAFAIFLLVIAADYARRMVANKPAVKRAQLPWYYMGGVGAVAGVCFGFFAIGGGVITVPLLTMFFGLTQMEAQGMTLAFTLPQSVVTTVTYASAHDVNWFAGIPLAIGGICAVPLGVDVAAKLPEKVLRSCFMVFVVVVAISMLAHN